MRRVLSQKSLQTLAILGLLTLSACEAGGVQPNGESGAASPAPEAHASSTAPAPTGEALAVRDKAAQGLGACLKLCDKTSALHCEDQSGCAEGCADMQQAVGHCAPLMDGFMACMLEQPTSSFECNEEDVPAVKDGVCDAAQAAVAKCLMGKA